MSLVGAGQVRDFTKGLPTEFAVYYKDEVRLSGADWLKQGQRLREAEGNLERVKEALREYGDHQNFRCGHPDRWPWDPDCPCGLTKTLRSFGVDPGAEPKVEPSQQDQVV